jgi:hypothetical protein
MTSSRSIGLHNSMVTRWILVCITCIALGFHLWGIRQNLPYTPEEDETTKVQPAVRMAASGSLNPGWFGNPGSTIIYPLAAIYRIWHAVAHGGTLFRPDPNLQVAFNSSSYEFYLLGRLMTIGYAVISVPIIYQIGRQAFGERVGLVGSWFSLLYPIAVEHAQMVRTDSAAVFFGMLSLWLCLKLYDRPTIRNQIMAGLAIGLSIATRYFMVALIPVLLAVDGLVLWRQASRSARLKANWLGIGTGLLTVAVAFALSTPYFFLDFTTALENLAYEARSPLVGGLSPSGNFLWYLTRAIPQSITWPQTMLAALGIALVLWRRQPQQMLLLGFVVTFLTGISLSPLHWYRWIIQILPLFALFISCALDAIIVFLSTRLRLTPSVQRGLIISALLLVSVWPAYQLVLLDLRQSSPSTRILAREWILRNLPAGSRITHEHYSVPLVRTDFVVSERFSLATNRTVDDYYHDGYRYLVVSSAIYGRYLYLPDRYSSEAAFYQTLFAEGHLLQQFEPSTTCGGPVIRIDELTPPCAVSMSFDSAFYDEEVYGDHWWSWMSNDGQVSFTNLWKHSLRANVHFTSWSLAQDRTLQILQDGEMLAKLVVPVESTEFSLWDMTLEPGRNTFTFSTSPGAEVVDSVLHNDDSREVSIALSNIKVNRCRHAGLPPTAKRLEADFGGQVKLLSFDIRPKGGKIIAPYGRLRVTLYWQSLAEVGKDYTVFVHLVDQAGRIYSQHDGQPAAGLYPTSKWKAGEIIEDVHLIGAPADIPAGRYSLNVGMYLLSTMERLQISSVTAQADYVVLDSVEVLPGATKG